MPRAMLRQAMTASLGRRLSLNLLAYSLIGLIAILLLLDVVIDQRFSRLEEQEIQGHIDRTEATLESLQEAAGELSLDWAVWNDTFDYIHSPNAAYETANFNVSSFQNIDTTAMGFVRFDGTFRKAVYFDLASEAVDAPAQAAFERRIAAPGFIETMRGRKTRQGFIRIGPRILVIGAAQVLRSDGSGVPEGFLVMAKELRDEDLVQALQLPAKLDLAAGAAPTAIERLPAKVSIAKRIDGFDGAPVASVRISIRRSLKQEGETLIWLTAGGIAALLVAMLMLLSLRLRQDLIKPVAAFQAHVSRISQSGDLELYEEDQRNDELGALYREFNAMAEELNSLRAKVEAQSFAIGRSESAVGIMHNIRNAISPVQAILSSLNDRMRYPAEANIQRALGELAADTAEPARREQLVAFLQAAINQARDELAQHRSHLHEALRGVAQVVETIASAQSLEDSAKSAGLDCDLSAVINASSAIVRHSRASEVAVEFTSEERFRVAAPRVLVAQVIDNLLTNAVEAIAATARGHGTIAIHAARDAGLENHVRLTIRDDGDGFVPGEAQSLFERGKTGREKTAGGIGLHWSANTVNALGGSITISSGGHREGATVVLTLPLLAEQSGDGAQPVATAA